MNLRYVIPRAVRHFLPERVTRFLLLRNWIIQASYETNNAQFAVRRYIEALESQGKSLQGRRVMVFGYGGRFDIGLALLEAGAGFIVLCEKYAEPDETHNRALLEKYPSLLFLDRGLVRPRPECMTLLQADIREVTHEQCPAVDVVISNSVYEHLDDVEGITQSLSALTKPDGVHIHFVDLRDHYFKYPFEMLKFSEEVWYRWLNPTSNHNRFRLWDHGKVFEKYFGVVNIKILARDEANFEKARPQVLPEFISGKLEDDSVTLIQVYAASPKRNR
jgi:SAM-dependent methyltransferase